jgi:hypothetical protein
VAAFFRLLIEEDREFERVRHSRGNIVDPSMHLLGVATPRRNKRTDIERADPGMDPDVPVQIDARKRRLAKVEQSRANVSLIARKRRYRAVVVYVACKVVRMHTVQFQHGAELSQKVRVATERPIGNAEDLHYIPTVL